MNPYSTLSRRGFLNLAGAVGVSLVLPKLSFAATADGAVAESIGKFEDYLLNRLVSGMPQSGRGALQDLVARRGTYIEALLGGTATMETFVENAALPFARAVNATLAAAAVSDKSPALSKPAAQKFIKPRADGSIIIPPQSSCTYTVGGLCMDRALPAPVKGDALILTPIAGQVPEAMQPLMAVVAASAGSDQVSRNRAQRMLWALMSAGTQEGERVSQATLKDLDAIAPGGAQQFLDYHKAQLAKQGASRPVSVNARDADDAAIAREILRLQEAGERMDNGKGYGYSMVNDGAIAARATGTAPLEAKVELLNDTYDEQAFRPGAYNFKALAKKQRAYPSQRHTDGAGPYGLGGYISPAGPLDVGNAEDVIKALADNGCLYSAPAQSPLTADELIKQLAAEELAAKKCAYATAQGGVMNVGRAEDVAKGLVFLGEQVIFEGSSLDKPTRGSRQVSGELSKRKAGAVSKAVVKGLQDSPQALNLLHVAQAATGRHWSQE